jgi:hypothetical protein
VKKKVNNKKNASDLNTGTLTNNETECADDVKSSRANIDIGTAARLWNASFWSGLIGIIPTIIMMYKKSLRYFNADVLKSSTLASGYLAIYIPVACGGVIVGSVLAAVGKRLAYRGKSAIVPMFFAFLCFTWQYTVTLVLYGHDDALLFGSLPAVAALLTAAGIYYEVFSGWKKKKSSDNSPSKKDNSI